MVGLQGDVGIAADVQRVYDEAMTAFGRIDIAVNNAGTSRNGAFENLTDEILHYDLEQKLFAAVRMARLVWPQMKERRYGASSTCSMSAPRRRARGSAPTSISRAAGMAFTKVLANEGAPHNILVNALLVGLIEADQHVQAAKRKGVAVEDYLAGLAKDIPLGRIGAPKSSPISPASSSPMRARYVTGTAINVDGGRSPVV